MLFKGRQPPLRFLRPPLPPPPRKLPQTHHAPLSRVLRRAFRIEAVALPPPGSCDAHLRRKVAGRSSNHKQARAPRNHLRARDHRRALTRAISNVSPSPPPDAPALRTGAPMVGE